MMMDSCQVKWTCNIYYNVTTQSGALGIIAVFLKTKDSQVSLSAN